MLSRIAIVFALLHCGTASADEATPPRNEILERLTGTWDVQYKIFGKDGSVRKYRGQVHYTRILDGKALQEIWTSDSQDAQPRPYGTTISYFDPKQRRWTAVWIYPAQGQTTVVTGGMVDGKYVLTGTDEAGALQRWATIAEGPDTVVGRFEVSEDQGKTWRTVGMNTLRRSEGR